MVSGALAPGVMTSSDELVDELAVLLADASGVTCTGDFPGQVKAQLRGRQRLKSRC